MNSSVLLGLEYSSSTSEVTEHHPGIVDGEGEGDLEEALDREAARLAGDSSLAALS